MTSDLNPFIQIHSLPWPVQAARPGHRQWATGLTANMANISITNEGSNADRLVIDGEVWRSELMLAYGVTPRFDVGLVLPLVSHQGGIFDGFIRNWHDTFGLSNTRRDSFDDYSLNYQYIEDGETRFELDAPATGIGDIYLSGAWHWRELADGGRSLTLRGGVKLPTGSATRLHGSGGTDLSLQLQSIDIRTLSRWDVTLAWMAGAMWLGDGEVLDDLRRDHVAIGSLAVVRPVWRNLLVKAQLDGHSSFYDTDLEALGSATVQFSFGGGIRLGEGGMIDIGLVESLFSDTSPDFGIHLGWHRLL